MKLIKIPTGIRSFDVNINDGFPAGSVILLLENIGAGAREFLYSSISNISEMKKENFNIKKYTSVEDGSEIILPEKICYISLSRSLEDISKENAYSFRKSSKYIQEIVFKDFSDMYFQNKKEYFSSKKNGCGGDCDILKNISEFIDTNAKNNIIIIDSLTDLVIFEAYNRDDIIIFLKQMSRISKVWNGLIYIILGSDILDTKMQEIIKDIVDGVLVFEWNERGSDKMRRNLYLSKFRGLIPRLEQNKIAKFETRVTYDGGFEVSNVKKII